MGVVKQRDEFPSRKPLWVNQNGKNTPTPPVFS
jgi:hypothetical protein